MEENAVLWTSTDDKQARIELKRFLDEVEVEYTENMTTEELRNLYVKYECGEI